MNSGERDERRWGQVRLGKNRWERLEEVGREQGELM